MQMNSLQKVVMVLKISVVTVIDSLQVIFATFFLKNKQVHAHRIVLAWARKILRFLRVKYTVFDPYVLDFFSDRPYIIMSNHASHFDIPLMYTTFSKQSLGMIAKKELFRFPIFGRGMKIAGCISIDRENRQQAVKDLAAAKKSMLNGVRLWIAPEGTRSLTGKMGVFKKGGFKIALDTQAIIVPVTIVGAGKILPAKTFDFSMDEKVEVHIGRPIDTTDYQLKDLPQLIADTCRAISDNLNQ
ncbi:MAG: 1-acyl-sn-glycerol-3-phosphate acyltransferase [Gammaproteobacteria bacterium]|nr:1-acyl-sn-glycerol-3-phosphate acyltransferase [Gammaproteobacteria bacterium]